MKLIPIERLGCLLALLTTVMLCQAPLRAAASDAPAVSDATQAASAVEPPAAKADQDEEEDWDSRDRDEGHHADLKREREARHHHRHHDDDAIVSIGHDAHLPADKHADGVVSVFGSSTSEGAAEDVVAVFGDARVTGPVKDNAVAVLGDLYIDAKVDGDAVVVFGNLQLGPHAEIDGDVTSVFGTVRRDPAAIVRGSESNVLGGGMQEATGLHAWFKHCLVYGRPLALAPDLGWAWMLAAGFLLLYICLALLFKPALTRCIETIETQPGRTTLAALLTMLVTPVLIVLLCATVVGIAVVPFVVGALFCAALFGKAVILGAIGRRIVRDRPGALGHPALAVLLGGVIVTALYLVPVVGFIVYKLLGILGLGAVVYALILRLRAHQLAKSELKPAEAAPEASYGGIGGGVEQPAANPAASAATAMAASAALPHAGFWIRMAALAIDIILIGIILHLLRPLEHFHLLVLAAYGAVMWKLRGSTLGGIICDLRVVRLDGRALDWETVIVRALSCFLSLAVVGLGFIWIAFDHSGQAWHDKIAGTVVVRVPKGTRTN